jgi:DNA polymerase V
MQHIQILPTTRFFTEPLPFFCSPVPAGFPSPGDDFIEVKLDLNEHLVRHPAATFFVRASGESMIEAGINNDDILLVDRSLEPYDGAVVVAVVGGELTVKRFEIGEERMGEDEGFEFWGVVTYIIHKIT